MSNNGKQNLELPSNSWVNKSHALNEIRNCKMTISQMRLFTIYLSKVNPKDLKSREVTFKLKDYTKIMQFKQTNTTRLIKTAEDLLGLTVKYWDKTGQYNNNGVIGVVICQVFKRFKLYKNKEGEWFVSIDCHDDVVKHLFDLKNHYLKYQLWNALQLTSTNQQRMYELLKQYERAGLREISIKDLREYIGLRPEEYPRWERFRTRVLDTSQEALANYTDIKFTWEVTGKKGKGGKIKYIRFNVEKNDGYIRQLTLEDFLTEQEILELEETPAEFERPDKIDSGYDDDYEDGISPFTERINFLSDACNKEFSRQEMVVLNTKLRKYLSYDEFEDEIYCYDYLSDRYNEMLRRAEQAVITNRFGYLKSLISKDI